MPWPRHVMWLLQSPGMKRWPRLARARAAALFWRQVENQRKSPLRVIRAFGWIAVMRYVLGGMTLAGALDRVSHRLGFKVGVVILPFPEAAIDVDSARDWYVARRIAGEKDIDHLHLFP